MMHSIADYMGNYGDGLTPAIRSIYGARFSGFSDDATTIDAVAYIKNLGNIFLQQFKTIVDKTAAVDDGTLAKEPWISTDKWNVAKSALKASSVLRTISIVPSQAKEQYDALNNIFKAITSISANLESRALGYSEPQDHWKIDLVQYARDWLRQAMESVISAIRQFTDYFAEIEEKQKKEVTEKLEETSKSLEKASIRQYDLEKISAQKEAEAVATEKAKAEAERFKSEAVKFTAEAPIRSQELEIQRAQFLAQQQAQQRQWAIEAANVPYKRIAYIAGAGALVVTLFIVIFKRKKLPAIQQKQPIQQRQLPVPVAMAR